MCLCMSIDTVYSISCNSDLSRERDTHKVDEIKKNNMSVLVDIFDVSWCREERRERERGYLFVSTDVSYPKLSPIDLSPSQWTFRLVLRKFPATNSFCYTCPHRLNFSFSIPSLSTCLLEWARRWLLSIS